MTSNAPTTSELASTNGVCGVLFADISGSTKLYESLGDQQAKLLVDECIAIMRATTSQFGGRVIKTIGDEVMCVLPNADASFLAATDMQLRISALPETSGVKRAIRVGFHVGSVIEENNDVFGDTVNLAARMAGLAKGSQIITTLAAVEQLALPLRASTRNIAALAIKGKGDEVAVCEVIWQAGEDLTMTSPSTLQTAKEPLLTLAHGAEVLHVRKTNGSVMLGRDTGCQVVISDRMASRQHARVELRRDKFFLIDQSTNGTFVTAPGEPIISLRREEVMLRGSGRITFGHTEQNAAEDFVEYRLSD